MADLYFFDDVFNVIQGGKPQKKRSKKQLVKAVSLIQGTRSNQLAGKGSQDVDVKAIQPLKIVYAMPALQVARTSKRPIQVPFDDGLDKEDQVPINDQHGRKRRATAPFEIPSTAKGRAVTPRPRKVDTWQPSRALEWISVS